MSKISKRFKANKALVEPGKVYPIAMAIELVQKTANTKFASSVETHIRLGIDPKKTEQNVRGTATLPHGTGKSKKIAAFVTEAKEKTAKAAGAAIVGGEELIKKIKETEKTDFDIAIAEPAMMKLLAPIAKILGQRGLMPNPKTGTVTEDIAGIIKEISGGKIDFKNDESGNIHQIIGRANFDKEKLEQNFKVLLDAVNAAKPTTVKKQYILGVAINATMGPAIKVKM